MHGDLQHLVTHQLVSLPMGSLPVRHTQLTPHQATSTMHQVLLSLELGCVRSGIAV